MIIFKNNINTHKRFTFNALFDTSIESIKLYSYKKWGRALAIVTIEGGLAARCDWRFFINQYKVVFHDFNKTSHRYSQYEEEYL
jgi:hypothetical protein